ncbi:hypothetical protein OG293_24200 [Streptomyces sp. NBC_00829]|nr:hypothetical protein OG293_24200 [Streptomyces sp. NBC_00829]
MQRWRHAWVEGDPRALRSSGPASLPRWSEEQFAQLERVKTGRTFADGSPPPPGGGCRSARARSSRG